MSETASTYEVPPVPLGADEIPATGEVTDEALAESQRDLAAAAHDVLRARHERDVLQGALKERLAAFEASLGTLRTQLSEAVAACEASEADCRAEIEYAYRLTKIRRPFPGLEVRVETVLTYDEGEALAFCQHIGQFVVPASLDRRGFEKMARVVELPWVAKTERAKGTIATDLAKALGTTQDACA